MRKSLLTASALVCMVGAFAAEAGNSVVENALKSRPDLSSFYQGLASTGVINELKEGQSYTVFAPTNEAFARLSPDKYPCFYSAQCKAQVADILRNHIVEGEKHVEDVSVPGNRIHETGNIMSLFSINSAHLIVSEPYKSSYTVNGRAIVSRNQLMGAELYPIDGVLASERDLVQFTTPQVSVVRVTTPGTDLPPRTPDGSVVTITTQQPVVPSTPAPELAPSSSGY